jgi:AhpD family alkylhydroperoxidase
MSLTSIEKELVNVGASVATGCKPCTDYHFEKVRDAGASDREIEQAISDALAIRDSARTIMERHGLSHLGIPKPVEDCCLPSGTTRIRELVAVGAALAVNCTTNLERHLATARTLDITEDEIRAVRDAVVFIKGEAAHYVGQIVELTEQNIRLQELLEELQQTQAQLVQSEKMAALGKLVAGLVHEMNSPLGTLNGAVDVATRSIEKILGVLESSTSLEDALGSRQFQNSARALRDIAPLSTAASSRISRIVDSLKSFSRLDQAPLQTVNLHEALETTLTLMEHDLKGRIRVEKDYGDIPQVMCYPGELNQVWMSLFSNASQAIGEKGAITVRTFAEGANVHVEIADTGIGIPSGQIQYLFDPSFTSRGERVKAGMGLFISYNIVRKHRGEIKVESEVGRGSTFTVILPRVLQEGPLAKEKTKATERAANRCSRLDQ